jgi:hypothetical protein
MKSKRFILRTYLVLFFFVLISFTFIALPLSSLAKLRPLDDNFSMSWGVAPPGWFRINSVPTRPTPVWFDVDVTNSEAKEEQPVAKALSGDIKESVFSGIIVRYDELGVISVTDLYFMDSLDLQVVWCDDDGLIDDGSHLPWTSETTKGCVRVDIHAEILERQGDTAVATHVAADSGTYKEYAGETFLRIYFPESVTASLQQYDATIMLGSCEDGNPEQYNTLGSLYLKDIRVNVHQNSWTDISVHR